MNPLLRFLIALVSTALSSATYIIDDTNTTAQYSGSSLYSVGWVKLHNSTYYNGTMTWIACFTSDNCHMKIPFTGSGITLFMVQEYASSFLVSIDGGTPASSFSFPKGDPFGQLNVTAYDKQSLQSGNHTLDLMLFDTTDTQDSLSSTTLSYFSFDYAVVNETNAFPTLATASSTAQMTQILMPPFHTSMSGHSSVMAPAVGCALGGIVVIIAGISIFYWLRKRNHRQPLPGEYVPSPFDQQVSRLHSNAEQPMPGLKNIVLPANTPPAAPPPPSRNTPVISTHPPQPPTSLAPSSNLATALDAVSRLRPTVGQRHVLMESLNAAPSLPASPLTLADGRPRTHPIMPEVSDAPQQTELMATLDSFSRLTPAERRTLVSVLNTLMASSGDSTGHDTVFSSPPPYSD